MKKERQLSEVSHARLTAFHEQERQKFIKKVKYTLIERALQLNFITSDDFSGDFTLENTNAIFSELESNERFQRAYLSLLNVVKPGMNIVILQLFDHSLAGLEVPFLPINLEKARPIISQL